MSAVNGWAGVGLEERGMAAVLRLKRSLKLRWGGRSSVKLGGYLCLGRYRKL